MSYSNASKENTLLKAELLISDFSQHALMMQKEQFHKKFISEELAGPKRACLLSQRVKCVDDKKGEESHCMVSP